MDSKHNADSIDDNSDERMLRDAHDSLAITWHSGAEREIGSFRFERVGFADIPRLRVSVTCKERDFSSLVPSIRQLAFGHLGELGWSSDHIQFKPTVGRGRTSMFIDQ